jgi:anhydro-N-acetylmuramic acid kinase
MRVVGVMSGTSGDGIDVAVTTILPVSLDGEGDITGVWPPPSVELVGSTTIPFTPATRDLLFKLFSQEVTLKEVCDANYTLGGVFGDAVVAACAELGIELSSIDLVASHGQTIYHNPPLSTLQIGDAAVIAQRCRCTVAADFRAADVAYGGQGAPVTSIVDTLYLARKGGWRAVQNIGGFGNVTFVPPIGTAGGRALAFDTGPGNALLDGAVETLTKGAQQYDMDGAIAATSMADPKLLETMLAHPYFARAPPKTTGREEFTAILGQEWIASGATLGLNDACVIATFTELTAVTIADAYASYVPCGAVPTDGSAGLCEVVIGGGGGSNPVMMTRLQHHLDLRWRAAGAEAGPKVMSHEDVGWDSDAKEAVTFAILGWLCVHGRTGNVPSCTGASAAAVLGKISPGANYSELLAKLQRE